MLWYWKEYWLILKQVSISKQEECSNKLKLQEETAFCYKNSFKELHWNMTFIY